MGAAHGTPDDIIHNQTQLSHSDNSGTNTTHTTSEESDNLPDATESHPAIGKGARCDTHTGLLHTEKARYLDVLPDVEQLKVAPLTADFAPQLGKLVLLSPLVETKGNLSKNRQHIVK
ncbi:hypothetical protein RAZWK3B_09251 [Roseobacter sp. AzwK-3b]|nr:hypothetical protein RAZWK3B_09251 [Roseobacter sp. AzwK-3b]